MSLEESDDLNIPDAEPIDPAFEACSLPKFDMHLYKSSLIETNIKWAGKNCKLCLKDAPTSLKKCKDKFFLVARRAAPIAMAWRHHDSSVADLFPRPSEYDASDVAKLREVVISLRKPPPSVLYVAGLFNFWKHVGRAFSLRDLKGKVVTIVEFLRLPNFKGCKVSAGTLLPPGSARVLDDKKKMKRKSEEKATAYAADADIQVDKVVTKRGAGKEDVCKKRRVRVGAPVQRDSEHVSSLTPLNHAKPLETLANTKHVSHNASVGRMGALRNQTDEHAPPPVGSPACRPSLAPVGPLFEIVERSARDRLCRK
nr:hypothetical protein [Tanacetum cinerariifolium]